MQTEAGLSTSSSCGVLQPAHEGSIPTVYHAGTILAENKHESIPVGKNDAHMACMLLLKNFPQAASIDVTDEIGFPWQRFLRSQPHLREIIGPGVVKVCVVLRANGPSLAFVRTDGLTYIVTPGDMKHVPPYDVRNQNEVSLFPTFVAPCSWMRMT